MTPGDFMDLMTMMVFSMLAALVFIDLLALRGGSRSVRRSARVRIWLGRLGVVALGLIASLALPDLAPAFLSAALVFVLFGTGDAYSSDGRRSSILLMLGRSQ